MKGIETLRVTDEVRESIRELAERLGTVRSVMAPGWQHIADQCDIAFTEQHGAAPLVFGPPAFVLKHAAQATTPFGFVMVVAQRSRRWPRTPSWRDDATLELWRAGWSVLGIDRLVIPDRDRDLDVAIGDVSRIPQVDRSSSR